MHVPKIYLETSVFNFVFADDAPEKQKATIILFDEIKQKNMKPILQNSFWMK